MAFQPPDPLPDTMPPRRWRSSWLVHLPAAPLILLIKVYQYTLGPMLGPVCRFYPSCSQYWVEALLRYGLLRGIYRGIHRLCRCHPLHPGGYDPP